MGVRGRLALQKLWGGDEHDWRKSHAEVIDDITADNSIACGIKTRVIRKSSFSCFLFAGEKRPYVLLYFRCIAPKTIREHGHVLHSAQPHTHSNGVLLQTSFIRKVFSDTSLLV